MPEINATIDRYKLDTTSGDLPRTFNSSKKDLHAFGDYSMANRTCRYFSGTPLHAFGYELSCTEFDHRGDKLESAAVSADGTVKLPLTIDSIGKMDGADVPQVYYRHVKPCVPQPKLLLCGFARVEM